MKLELGIIPIKDIQFGAESKVENGTIYVNVDELKSLLLEDETLKSVDFQIAKPGESVRIMPVKEVLACKGQRRGSHGPGDDLQGCHSRKRTDKRSSRKRCCYHW